MTAAAYRGLGMVLLAAGVVLALLGGARLDGHVPKGSPPRSRPAWPLYGGGVTLLLAATILLRRFQGSHADREEGAESALAILTTTARRVGRVAAGKAPSSAESGAGILPLALEVLVEAPAPPPEEAAAYLLWLKLQLDPVLDEELPRLWACREAYRRRHGLSAFAALFGPLAQGERLLYRAWSAAVDGYAEEARSALQQAADALRRAEAAALPR